MKMQNKKILKRALIELLQSNYLKKNERKCTDAK